MIKRNLIKLFKEESKYTKKSLGQHFLTNQHIIEQIVASAEIDENCNIIEIGPGCGVLTEHLVDTPAHLTAVEIDTDLTYFLIRQFEDKTNFEVVNEDASKLDFRTLLNKDSKIVYVGNLPYNISVRILTQITNDIDRIKSVVFMFQKEVANRINAKPNSKEYSSLSVFASYYYEISKVRDIGGNNFMPNTKVQSTVLKFVPHKTRLLESSQEEEFFKFINTAFTQKRKTLKNNLRVIMDVTNILDELAIKPSVRAEELSIIDFVKLFNRISSEV